VLGYLRDPRLMHEGAHSLIYRGHIEGDRPVVVKLTREEHPGPRALARLRREHGLLSRIRSPAVVRPLGLVEDGHRLALLLDDQGSRSLDQLLSADRGLPLEAFFQVGIDLAEGLAALHAAGVLHRDVKPSNVVVQPGTWHAQLIDLGLAATLVDGPDVGAPHGRFGGSLPYLSPEQTGRIDRAVDARSDLYSLGATLYELLTGGPPFSAATAGAFVHHHLASRPRPVAELRPDAPAELGAMIEVLLSKDPDARYPSAWAVRLDLMSARNRWCGGASSHTAVGAALRHPAFGRPGRAYGRETQEAAIEAAVERAASGGASSC
jgi:serine/threonine protein kinase